MTAANSHSRRCAGAKYSHLDEHPDFIKTLVANPEIAARWHRPTASHRHPNQPPRDHNVEPSDLSEPAGAGCPRERRQVGSDRCGYPRPMRRQGTRRPTVNDPLRGPGPVLGLWSVTADKLMRARTVFRLGQEQNQPSRSDHSTILFPESPSTSATRRPSTTIETAPSTSISILFSSASDRRQRDFGSAPRRSRFSASNCSGYSANRRFE